MVVSQVISANYEFFGEVIGNVNRRYVGLFSYDLKMALTSLFWSMIARYVGLFSYDDLCGAGLSFFFAKVIARYVGLFSYDFYHRFRRGAKALSETGDCPLCRAFFIWQLKMDRDLCNFNPMTWLPAMSGFFHMTRVSLHNSSSLTQKKSDCPLCRAFFIWRSDKYVPLPAKEGYCDCPLCRAFFIWRHIDSSGRPVATCDCPLCRAFFIWRSESIR